MDVTRFPGKNAKFHRNAAELTDRLNALAKDSPQASEVERISRRLEYRKAVRLISLLHTLADSGRVAPTRQQFDQAKHLLRLLDIRKWTLVPRADPEGKRILGWRAGQTGPVWRHVRHLVATLSASGELAQVRQCPCGKWFAAYSKRNRFCSRDCQKHFEAKEQKTEEGRKKAREKMRHWRANPRAKMIQARKEERHALSTRQG